MLPRKLDTWTGNASCRGRDITALQQYVLDKTRKRGYLASLLNKYGLLDKFGGVWADSTMLCMEPLDKWLKPNTDFWMYHGWENCKYGAIWFIISKPGKYTIGIITWHIFIYLV
jgi:hypothetical protein